MTELFTYDAVAALAMVFLVSIISMLLWYSCRRGERIRQLIDSERRLKLIAESAGVAAWEYDPRNDQLSRFANLEERYAMAPRNPCSLETYLDTVYPADRERLIRIFQSPSSAEHSDRNGCDFRVMRPDRGVRWLSATREAVERDKTGNATLLRGCLSDIDERKRAQSALAEKHRMLSSLMNNLHGMAYRCRNDKDRTMEFASEGCLQLTGYPAEDLIGNRATRYAELIYPADREAVWHQVRMKVAKGERFDVEYRLQTKNGDEKWVKEMGGGVLDSQGTLLALEGTILDNNTYKRAEFALKESESRFRTFFDQAGAGMAEIDTASGRFLRVNRYYCDLLGYSAEEMGELNFQALTHSDDLREDLENMERLVAGEIRNFSMEKRYWHKNGSTVWVNLAVTPLWPPGEQPTRHLALVEDISARKRAEEESRRAQAKSHELLAEADKARLSLLSVIEDEKKAQVALRESEARLTAFLAHTPAAMYIKDSHSRMIYANSYLKDHFGFENWQGKSTTELFPGAAGEGLVAADRRALEAGYTLDTFTLVDLHGAPRDFEAHKFAIPMGDKAPMLGGISLDVTERNQARQNLLDQKLALEQIVDNLPVALIIADTQRCITRVNPMFCQIFGYSAKEVLGKETKMLYARAEDFIEQGKRVFNPAVRDCNEPYEVEYRRRNGECFPGESVGTPMRDSKDRLIGMLGLITDRTERKRVEQELHKQEELLREMGRVAKIGGWEFDVETGEGSWTDQVAYIHDMAPEATTSRDISLSYYDGKGREAIDAAIRRAVERAMPYDIEVDIVTARNRHKWLRHIGHPVIEDGKVIKLRGSTQDVTEKKSIERELRRSKAFLETIIEKSPFPMWVSDDFGTLLSINQACRDLLHITEEEVVGKYNILKDSIAIDQGLLPVIESVYRQGKQVNFTIEWAAKDLRGLEFKESAPVVLDVTISPITDENGKTSYAIVQHIDITKLRRTEAQLRQALEQTEQRVVERTHDLAIANERLKELDQLKSMFIASMSHELRTPLNSIIGFTGMIVGDMAGPITDQQRDFLQRALRAGKHLLSLITDIIDVSKVEAGKIDIQPESFDLEAVLTEALQATEVQAKEKGLTLASRIPTGITLHSERKRLLQCLLNFLSNAVKYSERGAIRLEAEQVDETVLIRIKDEGIGISEDQLTRLFHPFVRLTSRLKVQNQGTGLGLYLTRKLAEDVLGGEVSVQSELGEGSTFTLRIPRQMPTFPDAEKG